MGNHLSLIDPVVGEEELEMIRSVLESGYMTQGPYAEEFERRVADAVGAGHGIAVTSCTTGMELALEVYGVGPGDEVIVPDFTYPATANVVERVGANPVLIDIDRKTYNIDADAAQEALTDRTAALLPVSWAGQPLDPKPLQELADAHDIPIIEDAACSFGAAFGGESVGSQFDASVFSFHPRKAITTGEGGVITLDDDDLAEDIRTIKNFGIAQGGTGSEFVRANATNYRLSDILAAVGVAQLDKQEEILGRRLELAKTYDELIEPLEGVSAPFVPEEAHHSYQNYCVYLDDGDGGTRDNIIEALRERDIEAQIGTFALHLTLAFEEAKRGSDLSNSRALFNNLLALPMMHTMSESDQIRVVDVLNDVLPATS